jgi:hypothetical protein
MSKVGKWSVSLRPRFHDEDAFTVLAVDSINVVDLQGAAGALEPDLVRTEDGLQKPQKKRPAYDHDQHGDQSRGPPFPDSLAQRPRACPREGPACVATAADQPGRKLLTAR